MSAASRKADPFNFDDIYRQAGVEDLFVKKTLGELKQQKPAAGPVPASSPARAAPAGPKQAPAQNASTLDLDFLSSLATPSGTPPHLSKPNSTNNLEGAGTSQPARSPQQQPQRTAKPAVSSPPVNDPFGLFNEVPGAAPAQRHAPPPPPAAPAANGLGDLLGFGDDGPAFPQATSAAPPAERPAGRLPAASPSPAIASVVSYSQPQPQPQPQSRPLAPETSMAGPAGSRPLQSQATSTPGPGPRPSLTQQQPLPSAAASPPPPDYASHTDYRSALPGAPRPYGPPSAAGAAPPPHAHLPDGRVPSAAAHQHQPGPAAAAVEARGFEPEPSNSSAPSFSWGQAPSGSGLSGVLKAFGKKAVRAAKAGLAQLEHALEGLDQPGGQGQGHGQAYAAAPSFGGRSSGSGGGRSYDDGVPISNDEALAWAVRLADLPPHTQAQELSHMTPALRRKVIDVLREQIRSEHEAAAGLAQQQPPLQPHPAEAAGAPGPAPSRPGAGHGHSPAPSPRSDAAAGGASPPGYGHGAGGAGAPPPPYRRPGSQDGGIGHPTAGPPPSYADAGYHAPAPVAPAAPPPPQSQPQQQVNETHDLLGMGSGEVPAPAGPALGTGPAAAATAARRPAATAGPQAAGAAAAAVPTGATVVVDDLIGFGDGPRPAATAAPASRTPMAVTAPAAAAPPPPPLPVPPATVHVEDMDDFFSGGRPSGGSAAGAAPAATGSAAAASRVASGSMHASSSAPNLGGRGGAASANSSSTAALADMLLHDDELGGGVADVDVAGYEDLYRGEQGQAGEPELRKRLRAQREAAKHAKMKAALAEKKTLEAEEAARREQQVALKDQYKANIEAWKNRHKGNIRGLLGSLHTVLWPDSGWTPVSVGDLLDPAQIKKVYMRANLLVHPDKVRQRSGSADQVALADMVFDVLKDAWNAFR